VFWHRLRDGILEAMKSGIYQIVNKVNGKRYIGSARRMQFRLWWHRSTLKHQKHSNPHLQAAWNLYGAENFSFEAVLICDATQLLIKEQQLIDFIGMENLYNILPKAGSPEGRSMPEAFKRARRAFRHSAEAKKAIGARWKGVKRGERTERHRLNLSISLKGRKAWNKKEWPRRTCLNCGAAFRVRPHKVKDGKGKYCSKACGNAGKRGISVAPQTEFQKGLIPWNKGTKGVCVAWNKGRGTSVKSLRRYAKLGLAPAA